MAKSNGRMAVAIYQWSHSDFYPDSTALPITKRSPSYHGKVTSNTGAMSYTEWEVDKWTWSMGGGGGGAIKSITTSDQEYMHYRGLSTSNRDGSNVSGSLKNAGFRDITAVKNYNKGRCGHAI